MEEIEDLYGVFFRLSKGIPLLYSIRDDNDLEARGWHEFPDYRVSEFILRIMIDNNWIKPYFSAPKKARGLRITPKGIKVSEYVIHHDRQPIG